MQLNVGKPAQFSSVPFYASKDVSLLSQTPFRSVESAAGTSLTSGGRQGSHCSMKKQLFSLLLLATARASFEDGGIGLETSADDGNEDYLEENAWLGRSDFEG